ncbi:MAG TPA: hypothetical protein PK079_20230 [Leptospiraceae bacterium]|nr:hypothetical protein [Leptospiraceae bacterium]HMW07080.1 hypothetical protein [Leptospiraceae bacterium]HMX34487.1 hypothetical protein [Leptospiraceae bacterium]HMY33753.1 hypothetical protein [Leptospiraceae bacterium]HMZ66881.1 hypothetical protein [Leptospiraceae bacterium]
MRTNTILYSNVIHQLTEHLAKISDNAYIDRLTMFGGSTLGEHVRHIYNFPECLINGIKNGIVNYEKRFRNPKIEENRVFAIESILEQVNLISELAVYPDKPLLLEIGLKGDNQIQTNFARELHYITEHTIHHMAIIRIGIEYLCPTLQVEPSFGVASSTIEYKKKLTHNFSE